MLKVDLKLPTQSSKDLLCPSVHGDVRQLVPPPNSSSPLPSILEAWPCWWVSEVALVAGTISRGGSPRSRPTWGTFKRSRHHVSPPRRRGSGRSSSRRWSTSTRLMFELHAEEGAEVAGAVPGTPCHRPAKPSPGRGPQPVAVGATVPAPEAPHTEVPGQIIGDVDQFQSAKLPAAELQKHQDPDEQQRPQALERPQARDHRVLAENRVPMGRQMPKW